MFFVAFTRDVCTVLIIFVQEKKIKQRHRLLCKHLVLNCTYSHIAHICLGRIACYLTETNPTFFCLLLLVFKNIAIYIYLDELPVP